MAMNPYDYDSQMLFFYDSVEMEGQADQFANESMANDPKDRVSVKDDSAVGVDGPASQDKGAVMDPGVGSGDAAPKPKLERGRSSMELQANDPTDDDDDGRPFPTFFTRDHHGNLNPGSSKKVWKDIMFQHVMAHIDAGNIPMPGHGESETEEPAQLNRRQRRSR